MLGSPFSGLTGQVECRGAILCARAILCAPTVGLITIDYLNFLLGVTNSCPWDACSMYFGVEGIGLDREGQRGGGIGEKGWYLFYFLLV